ncbi:MAG: ligand-binding SRPBCC domain-containing protein, partial [Bradymonadia bacterium]
EILTRALVDEEFRGPFNLAAPEPVTSEDFARALGKAVRRPAKLRAPAFALKLALGEAASVLLASQRAVPAKLSEWGYQFQWPDLNASLRDILEGGAPDIGAAPKSLPKTEYLRRRGATHVLQTETTLDAPLAEVFSFFSQAENLGALTPPALSFEIQPPVPATIEVGTHIRYRIKLGPVPMTWVTRFDVWEDQARFVDSQVRGPYRSWWHEHAFVAVGEQTMMRDTVYFKAPFGPLGRLAGLLFIRPLLRRIFGFRHHAVLARYGDPGSSATEATPVRAA